MRCLLLLTVVLSVGCAMPVSDPYTMSRIVNDTDTPIEVELTMDESRVHPSTPDEAREGLREFAQGAGVEVVSVDPARLVGRYRIAPSGFMVVHEGMGSEPYFLFNRMTLTDGRETRTVTGNQDIVKLFHQQDGSYECRLSATF